MDEVQFVIRKILPSDKLPLQLGLEELSAESIRQRFFSNKKEFSESELTFLTEVDQVNHLAYIAFPQEGELLKPAGVIRAVKNPSRPTHAEVGLIIIDSYQGQGLGTKLMNQLAEASLIAGITHFYGDYYDSNLKMIQLLRKFMKNRGAISLKHIGEGIVHFEAALL